MLRPPPVTTSRAPEEALSTLADEALAARGRALAYAAVFTQALISAFTYLVAQRALVDIPAVPLLTLRFLLAGLLFLALLWAGSPAALPPRALLPRLLWMGFLVGPINQGFFFYGLSLSTASHAALLYALTPLGVYLMAVLRGRERLAGGAMAGLASALCGVVVLLLARGLQQSRGPLVGDLLILLAVAAWVVFTDQGKALVPAHGAVRLTSWAMISGALLVVPLMPLVLERQHLAQSSAVTWACVGYLAVVTSVISYLLWYYALSKLDASKVAIFSNFQPVFTALASYWLLHEPLHWNLVVGGAAVLLGVRLIQTA